MTDNSPQTTLPAGNFSQWLAGIRNGSGGDVPCGDCNACCRSAYFIHIRAHESAALAAVPQVIRFPAPGACADTGPPDQVMGFNDQGACPMLQSGYCSIYQDRPQTCRDYDCRIFAACGIEAGDESKGDVNARVAQWRFAYPTQQDKSEQQALVAAVQFLKQEYRRIGLDEPLSNPTQLALLAIRVSDMFLTDADSTELPSIASRIRGIMESSRT